MNGQSPSDCSTRRAVTSSTTVQTCVVHGFDTFTGLPEAWAGMPKGSFNMGGHFPIAHPCGRFHKGLIADSLPEFIQSQPPGWGEGICGVNFDVDLYVGTVQALDGLDRELKVAALLHFHELQIENGASGGASSPSRARAHRSLFCLGSLRSRSAPVCPQGRDPTR